MAADAAFLQKLGNDLGLIRRIKKQFASAQTVGFIFKQII